MNQLGRQRGNILVVDDEKNYRIVLARLFEGAGYRVSVAHGAEAAMEILRQQQVALIISDLRLANQDGLYFCEQVRAQIGPIPCVVFTADASRVDHKARRLAGIVGCLEKPFDNLAILKLVADILSATERAESLAVNCVSERPSTEINISPE